MSRDIKVLPFMRKLRKCLKCGGKTKRSYCKGEYGDCADYGSPLQSKEHFDVVCQECHYEFYESVKP